MSFDERFLDCAIPDRGHEYRPLPELRWFAQGPQDHNPTLQQAWVPYYGGRFEWRNVPTVYATASGEGGKQ